MCKIGIMGGTFNPIHIGHLLLAECAMEEAGLEEVWLIPAGYPYQKSKDNILPGSERLYMAELAIRGNSKMRCLDLEINRKGFTYTYETLEELKYLYPNCEFYFIMGADCLNSLGSWKKPDIILQNSTVIAAVRDDVSMNEMEEKKNELVGLFGGEIILVPFIRMSISSSEIRKRIAENKSIRYLVPDDVKDYIEKKGFYRG